MSRGPWKNKAEPVGPEVKETQVAEAAKEPTGGFLVVMQRADGKLANVHPDDIREWTDGGWSVVENG